MYYCIKVVKLKNDTINDHGGNKKNMAKYDKKF